MERYLQVVTIKTEYQHLQGFSFCQHMLAHNINKRYMYGPSMNMTLYFNEDSLFLCSLFFGKQAGLFLHKVETHLYNPLKQHQIQMVNTGILLPAPFWGAQFNVDEQTFNTDEIGEVQTSVDWGLLEEFYSILHI